MACGFFGRCRICGCIMLMLRYYIPGGYGWYGRDGCASRCGTAIAARAAWQQRAEARANAVDEPGLEGSTEHGGEGWGVAPRPPLFPPPRLLAHSVRPRRALTNASYCHLT
ncbi:unnamed protein product [Parnassius mnemosyne]|uniref:Uncharacterized protein n=1 Tax=Parnassius mnemosyne TaxID=213953 RepID=A0AAV1L2K2_9NEOP